MKHPRRSVTAILLLLGSIVGALAPARAASSPGPAAPQWFKGNLHTHSLWSDGDDYPEMIADWYKREGYHFLAISDHNVLQVGQRWLEIKAPVSIKGEVIQRGGGEVLRKYLQRFGRDWVEQRETAGQLHVRLKPLDEYRALLEEPRRFLMLASSEITARWTRPTADGTPALGGPVHINVTNPREYIEPVNSDNAVESMQRTVDAIAAQRERTGQPMFPHINHPNFNWGITAEELMQVRGERFFEVYNGHPGVYNKGDAAHLSMDAMWDIVLTRRLTDLGLDVMYGIATDDSHHYHRIELGRSNTGRGWVMVRARHLTPESLILAMEAGDFYSTTGVTLQDVRQTSNRLTVEITPQRGVTYVTQFIGTRKGYDSTSEELPPVPGQQVRGLPHRRYSSDVGAVLAEVRGNRAEYTLRGDEIYVRAKVISSKPKVNGSVADEVETAWTQPLVNAPR